MNKVLHLFKYFGYSHPTIFEYVVNHRICHKYITTSEIR